MIFIRLQAANDAGDLNDLRAFTTPEMFAAVKLDLQERGPTAQRTDVVRVDAEVLDVASEADRQVVSVRFHGLIREQIDGVAEPFDEVWHLVKPADGSREWAIAGIQQVARPPPLEAVRRHRRVARHGRGAGRAAARRRRAHRCSASPGARTRRSAPSPPRSGATLRAMAGRPRRRRSPSPPACGDWLGRPRRRHASPRPPWSTTPAC